MTTVSDHAHTILEYIAAHPRSAETEVLNALLTQFNPTSSRYLLQHLVQEGFLSGNEDGYKITPAGIEALAQSEDARKHRADEEANRHADRRNNTLAAVIGGFVPFVIDYLKKILQILFHVL